jgi:hypothetical protein
MDLGDLEKIITKVATAKGFVIVLVLALTAFFVYRNFDFISKVTLEVAPRAPESRHSISPASTPADSNRSALLSVRRV